MSSPFVMQTTLPLVAMTGIRNGYVQLATSEEITTYGALPNELFMAAKAWAAQLETLGAQRVYWITLSEQVRHLHIHLYPRWSDEELRGLPLFEGRDTDPQPPWTPAVQDAFVHWCAQYYIAPANP